MHELQRTVRFCINPDFPAEPRAAPGMGYAGVPGPVGLARFYEFVVACRGIPDKTIGYLIDIKAIDQAVRRVAVTAIERACREDPALDPACVLAGVLGPLADALPVQLVSLRWNLSPYHAIAMATAQPTRVLLCQRFDFAAAHRLHVQGLSDEENRRLFGKCNNPSGHGHNYQIEPTVEVDLADEAGDSRPFGHAQLERLTGRVLIDPFDHTHLNEDTEAFGPEGVNPTVENIARVFFELLAPHIASASPAARLRSLTVWETDRTSATYPA